MADDGTGYTVNVKIYKGHNTICFYKFRRLWNFSHIRLIILVSRSKWWKNIYDNKIWCP